MYTINVNTPEKELKLRQWVTACQMVCLLVIHLALRKQYTMNHAGKNRLFNFTQYRYGGRALKGPCCRSGTDGRHPNHDLVLIQGGTGDNANYTTDVTPITNISKSAAIWFRWERAGAPGEYAQLKANLTAAANATVLVSFRWVMWQDLRANTAIDLFMT